MNNCFSQGRIQTKVEGGQLGEGPRTHRNVSVPKARESFWGIIP